MCAHAIAALLLLLTGCSSARPERSADESNDGGGPGGRSDGEANEGGNALAKTTEAGADAGDGGDAGNGCFLTTVGVYGECITTSACTARTGYTSTPGNCPGPGDVECCTLAPNVADDPPVPSGWQLMPQSAVTPAMTSWAVSILDDPTTYPMFSTTTKWFGSLDVMARVEWHPPDSQNSAVHRGVTLYEPD